MIKKNPKLLEVLKKDGVIAIATDGKEGAHLVATWNNFVKVIDDKTLAIPAGGYNKTQKNVEAGSMVQLMIGSKEVEGSKGSGTGFRVTATGSFQTEGQSYQVLKESYPWARAAFVLKVEKVECLM
jgi:hypothetical protein